MEDIQIQKKEIESCLLAEDIISYKEMHNEYKRKFLELKNLLRYTCTTHAYTYINVISIKKQ